MLMAGALVALWQTSPQEARAEVATSYPGGCVVVQALTPPNSCSYVKIGGGIEQITAIGSGTVRISGTCAGTLPTTAVNGLYPPLFGLGFPPNQTAGCTYTLTVTGNVTAYTEGTNPGSCVAENHGSLSPASCDYDANATSGTAIGQAIATTTSSVSLRVVDTITGTTVCNEPGNGLGSITVKCTFPEVLGHDHVATLSQTSGDSIPGLLAVNG
jgi:hypothetical protein